METVTLILIGLTVLFYFFMCYKRTNRLFCMCGSIIGVCGVASILTESWDSYTLLILLPVAYLTIMLILAVLFIEDE